MDIDNSRVLGPEIECKQLLTATVHLQRVIIAAIIVFTILLLIVTQQAPTEASQTNNQNGAQERPPSLRPLPQPHPRNAARVARCTAGTTASRWLKSHQPPGYGQDGIACQDGLLQLS
jgi:hypothetical protein